MRINEIELQVRKKWRRSTQIVTLNFSRCSLNHEVAPSLTATLIILISCLYLKLTAT